MGFGAEIMERSPRIIGNPLTLMDVGRGTAENT